MAAAQAVGIGAIPVAANRFAYLFSRVPMYLFDSIIRKDGYSNEQTVRSRPSILSNELDALDAVTVRSILHRLTVSTLLV